MQAPKNGFFYVLDAKTGELISAKPFTDISWATHVDKETGRPVETPASAFLSNGQAVRVDAEPQRRAHVALDVVQPRRPASSTFRFTCRISSSTHDADVRAVAVDDESGIGGARRDRSGRAGRGGAGALASVGGRLIAWDPVTQREVWRAEREGPANGGALSTAGGLVFQGTGTGTVHRPRRQERHDALVGRDADRRRRSARSLMRSAERQYVAVMVGTGGSWAMAGDEANTKGNNLPNISRLLVYALGGAAQLPPARPRPVAAARAAARDGSGERRWRAEKPCSGRIAGGATAARARRTSAFFRIFATARRSVRARRGPASSSAGSSRRTAWRRSRR